MTDGHDDDDDDERDEHDDNQFDFGRCVKSISLARLFYA